MLGLLSLEGSRTPPSLIGFEEPEMEYSQKESVKLLN